ncbi:MAG: monomeric [FeFe] hydrogenase [Bdellovibrionota bacterium]
MANILKSMHLNKEILVRLIRAFYKGDFPSNIRKVPFEMRPKDSEASYRCCIYKERAVIRDRVVAFLGFPLEEDNEEEGLREYAIRALERENVGTTHLTVLDNACKGCVPSRVFVTNLCQGCIARPCQNACKFDAINVVNGKAQIDANKCKNCLICVKECPYGAIVKRTVPCETACPVGAILKNENGFAKINYDKCISCGKCMMACPFGAVNEISQIVDVIKRLKNKEKLVALIAPAIVGQFKGNIYQLRAAIKKAGFFDVIEVSEGADKTINAEARELLKRCKDGAKLMTTSCCAGYKELVKKFIPELKEYVSDTRTPVSFTAEISKKLYEDAKTVFISPCVAKKAEMNIDANVDFVINFEELDALLLALEIDILDCKEESFRVEPSKQGRGFPLSGGVAEAVRFKANNENINVKIINGINKETFRELRSLPKLVESGKEFSKGCTLCEVMCCEGGCIGGNAVVNDGKISKNTLNKFLETSKDISKGVEK